MTEEFSSPYHLTLLRHGESLGNANSYYQGQFDFPLSENGERQVENLAQVWLLQGTTFLQIISSPLLRARQTAEILSKHLNIPIEINHSLTERDAGLLSGIHSDEAEEIYPQINTTNPYQPLGTTGESQWGLFLRAGEVIQALINREPAHYLIVSHGAFLNMMLYGMLGITPQASTFGAKFYFSNTGYASLSYYPQTHNWVFTSLINSQ